MKIKIASFLILFILSCSTFSYGFTSLTIWNNLETAEVNSNPSLENYLHLESESAILMEAQSGQILFEKEPHKKLRPASVTKVMSLLLIMEALDRGDITLETEISCSENASSMGGSQIWLDASENLTDHEMLKAI